VVSDPIMTRCDRMLAVSTDRSSMQKKGSKKDFFNKLAWNDVDEWAGDKNNIRKDRFIEILGGMSGKAVVDLVLSLLLLTLEPET